MVFVEVVREDVLLLVSDDNWIFGEVVFDVGELFFDLVLDLLLDDFVEVLLVLLEVVEESGQLQLILVFVCSLDDFSFDEIDFFGFDLFVDVVLVFGLVVLVDWLLLEQWGFGDDLVQLVQVGEMLDLSLEELVLFFDVLLESFELLLVLEFFDGFVEQELVFDVFDLLLLDVVLLELEGEVFVWEGLSLEELDFFDFDFFEV